MTGVMALCTGHHSAATYVLLLVFACLTSSSDVPLAPFPLPAPVPVPVSDMRYAGQVHELTKRDLEHAWSHVDVRTPDPALYSERLDIFLVRSATSWLDIRWQLDNRTGASHGVPRYSRVRYHIGNTTIFHNVFGSVSHFRIPNLSSNTEYFVCVEMLEKNDRHLNCARYRTIPLVRPDSILGLLLTLGYVFGMGMIGYITWCLRVRRYNATHKIEDEIELQSCQDNTIHFSDIEERVYLNSNLSRTSTS